MSTNPQLNPIKLTSGAKIASVTALDRIMWEFMHGRPECCIRAMMQFDRPLSDDILVNALKQLITLTPILSTQPRFRFWRGYWEFLNPNDISGLVSRMKVSSDEEEQKRLAYGVMAKPVDTSKPPYFRVTSVDGPCGSILILQTHHTIVDAGGAIRMFELFAKCYREIEKNPEWEAKTSLCMNRGYGQMMRQLKWWRFPLAPLAFVGLIFKILWRRVVCCSPIALVIIGDQADTTKLVDTPEPCAAITSIAPETMEKIWNWAKANGAKINDLIMAAQVSTIYQWNHVRGQGCMGVRSPYTVNLRHKWGEPEGTFANMSSFNVLHVDRPVTPGIALANLKPQLNRAKRSKYMKDIAFAMFLSVLPMSLIERIAIRVKRRVQSQARDSQLVANIGVIPESVGNYGSMRASSYVSGGPNIGGQSVLLSFASYRGTMTINMGYNSHHMNPETAQAYLECLRENFVKFGDDLYQPLPSYTRTDWVKHIG
jgi:NRPS condensation-like uncharacterized protein